MTDMSTPRERIEKFMELFQENVGVPTSALVMRHNPTGDDMTLSFEDLRAVLSANKSYESLMRDAAREAVAEYKKTLAAELRSQKDGKPSDRNEFPYIQGQDATLDRIADDLEDGTL